MTRPRRFAHADTDPRSQLKEAAARLGRDRRKTLDEIVDRASWSAMASRAVERTCGHGTSVPGHECNQYKWNRENMTRPRTAFRLGHRRCVNMAIACLIQLWITTIAVSGPRSRRLSTTWEGCGPPSRRSCFPRPLAQGSSRAGAQRFMATCGSVRAVSALLLDFPFEWPEGALLAISTRVR